MFVLFPINLFSYYFAGMYLGVNTPYREATLRIISKHDKMNKQP